MVIIAGSNQANKFTLIRVVNHKWSVLSSCFFFCFVLVFKNFIYFFFLPYSCLLFYCFKRLWETGVSVKIFLTRWVDLVFMYNMIPISSLYTSYILKCISEFFFTCPPITYSFNTCCEKLFSGFIFFLIKKKKKVIIFFFLMVSLIAQIKQHAVYKTDPFNN